MPGNTVLRSYLVEKKVGATPGFRLRGGEITRFEGLSDAVFAFAVTLLIVSLEVPRTFGQLEETMRGFFAFAICFTFLMLVWHRQYVFFRRYALQDGLTLFLNSVLLFVVLFYVYPLKFLFSIITNSLLGMPMRVRLPDGTFTAPILGEQMPLLMVIYGAGFAALSLAFTLMYWNAYRKRNELQLNAIECYDTVSVIGQTLIDVAAGVGSILVAVIGGPRYSAFAGLFYPAALLPGHTVYGMMRGRGRRRLETSA
jgi:uncharacterized membrane protein